jgi:hypothetical protein
MDEYTVTDVNPNSRLVAFRDSHGRYHAAHCASLLPALGEELRGSLPERGFTLLIGSDGGACRVTFSPIHSGQTWVFGVLHPSRESQSKGSTSVSRTGEVRKVSAGGHGFGEPGSPRWSAAPCRTGPSDLPSAERPSGPVASSADRSTGCR